MKKALIPYLLILVGLVLLVGGIANLDKVMTYNGLRPVTDKMGRNGARAALAGLGLVLAAVGGAIVAGVIPFGR